MKKKTVVKKSKRASKTVDAISLDAAKWRAEDDLRTLMRAEEIRADRARCDRAKALAKKQAMAASKIAK